MLFSNKSVEIDEDMEFSTENDPERSICQYTNLSERFLRPTKDFSKQYAHIYAARLAEMRQTLLAEVKTKWGGRHPVKKLFELREGKEETCVIIGTLFKHQKLKPSILKELSEELQLVPEPQRFNFVDESDKLILEDELQRIKLEGDVIDVHKMVTGVVVAVLGHTCYEKGDGVFKISDYCWPSSGPQKPLSTCKDDRFIVFASGLSLSAMDGNAMYVNMLADWILGLMGNSYQRKGISQIVRLVIAGNSVDSGLLNHGAKSESIVNTMSTGLTGVGFDSSDSVKRLDEVLNEICQGIEVDLMPGEFDPTNIMLPQKPMHFCMFPKASKMKSLNRVCNPYEFENEGRRVCGSSGQPVADLLRYSRLTSPLEALRCTLEWGHLAPTAPDTLPCLPSDNTDPYIIKHCPHIMFTGNAEAYESELYEGTRGQKVRLVCVPEFNKKRTIAVVNLKNLDCFDVTFR